MAKSAQRLKARRLRRKGFSINEIAKNVGFSKRTISRWCNDIFLNVKQKQVLWLRAKVKYNLNFKNYCESRHEATQEKIQTLKQEGIKAIGDLSKRDLFIAGVALYWAEGFKKDMRFGFANTDPGMIKFCLKWLKESLKIKNQEITLSVTANISYQDKIGAIEKYWVKVTGIPKTQFTKPFFQKTKWLKEYEKPNDYHGVLRIRVRRSTDLLRKVKGYIEGLKN